MCNAEILIGKKFNKKPEAWIAGKQSHLKLGPVVDEKYQWASHHPWLPVAIGTHRNQND